MKNRLTRSPVGYNDSGEDEGRGTASVFTRPRVLAHPGPWLFQRPRFARRPDPTENRKTTLALIAFAIGWAALVFICLGAGR